jgi:hypothetical protein
MFYQESEINEYLTCKKCKNKFNDPRLIDCGGSLCKTCIDLLIIDDENRFKCPVCEDLHEIPSNGFLKNEKISKFCDLKAKEVYRSPVVDSFRDQLDELKRSSDEFSNMIDFSDTKKKEHCKDLQAKVRLSKEKLIESVKEYNMDLIGQINKYEQDSKKKSEINDEDKLKFKKSVENTNKTHSEWMAYLEQVDLNDEKLKSASLYVKHSLENLKNKRWELVNQIFKGRWLSFVENATQNSSSLLGRFEDDDSQLVYQKQLNHLKSYGLRIRLYDITNECSASILSLGVQFLNNGNICIAYHDEYDEENPLKLFMFDAGFNKLANQSFQLSKFAEFKLAKLKNSIILALTTLIFSLSTCHDYDSEEFVSLDESRIMRLEEDFKKLNEIDVDYEIKATEGFESHLFCLSAIQDVNKKIFVYDENLVQIMSIGQHEDLSEPFFISDTFKKMRVCELYFVFSDGKQAVFVNRQNGLVEKQFNIDSLDFIMYGDGLNTFTYDGANSNLIKYDFNGYSHFFSLENANLRLKRKQNMKLVDCFNGRFIFLDNTNDDYFLIF